MLFEHRLFTGWERSPQALQMPFGAKCFPTAVCYQLLWSSERHAMRPPCAGVRHQCSNLGQVLPRLMCATVALKYINLCSELSLLIVMASGALDRLPRIPRMMLSYRVR